MESWKVPLKLGETYFRRKSNHTCSGLISSSSVRSLSGPLVWASRFDRVMGLLVCQSLLAFYDKSTMEHIPTGINFAITNCFSIHERWPTMLVHRDMSSCLVTRFHDLLTSRKIITHPHRPTSLGQAIADLCTSQLVLGECSREWGPKSPKGVARSPILSVQRTRSLPWRLYRHPIG